MTDTISPSIIILNPEQGSKNNSLNPRIRFRVEDDQGVNLNSIYLTIDNDFAIYQGVFRAGFDGYLASEGYGYYGEVERLASFEPLKTVNVSLSARDLANNPASTVVRSFITKDNLPPSLENLKPANEASQVDPTTVISFDLRTTPKETAVNINTLRFLVAGIELDSYGVQAIDSYGELLKTTIIEPDSLGQLVYDRRVASILTSDDGLGYSVQYIPLNPLPLSGRIKLFIQVEDEAGNLLDSQPSFTTIDDSAPILLDPLPLPGSTNNSIGAGISFTLSDRQESFLGSGVNKDSIQVRINGALAIKNGLAEPDFTATIADNRFLNGCDVQLASLALFNPRATVNIDIEASDFNGNTLLTNYFFTTNDVVAPTLEWLSPSFETGSARIELPILIKIKSEVSVQELDIASLVVKLNNQTIFANNHFEEGFRGRLFAESARVLVFSLDPITLQLDEDYTISLSIADVFGNLLEAENNFKTTNSLELRSFINPPPGIYSRKESEQFPEAGNLITLTLSSNTTSAQVFYTLDGSDPSLSEDGYPLGSTLLYGEALVLFTNEPKAIRYFAYEPTTKGKEQSINNAFYFFSRCTEVYEAEGVALFEGEDYLRAKVQKTTFEENQLIPDFGQKIGKFNYIYDLGRESYIDSLDFQNQGFVKLKARASSSIDGLGSLFWTGEYRSLYQSNYLTINEGYQVEILPVNNGFGLEIESKQSLWLDSTTLTFKESLDEGFDISFGIELDFNKELFYGASAGVVLSDDNYDLRIETIVSKVDRESNLLIGNLLQVQIDDAYLDGYQALIDGYEGYVVEVDQPTLIEEDLLLVETLTIPLVDAYNLPLNLGEVFEVTSYTEAVYNRFDYSSSSGGVRYTSALVGEINYKKIVANNQIGFALAAKDVFLDVSTAKLTSENLDPNLDQFIFAETNNFFEKSLFLESGDYNFRFYIEYQVENQVFSRKQAAPYLLKTREDLALVDFQDVLAIAGKEYLLSSAARSSVGEWYFDFLGEFPLDYQGPWSLKREGIIYLTSSEEILKESPFEALVGFDAEGIVGNITLESRGVLNFKYASSNATKISVIGTFNRFDASLDPMLKQFDPSSLKAIFDRIEDSYYSNNFSNWHKLTIEPTLPLIVENIKFKTLSVDGYQRARLVFDGRAIDRGIYKAKDSLGNPIPYQNNTDLFLPQDGSFVEWNFFKRAGEINSKLYKKLELWTRFDSGQGTRKHSELEIYTLPDLPLLVADYVVSQDLSKIERLNKTGFTSDTNLTAIKYSKIVELSNSIKQPVALVNDGVLENFLSARIVAAGLEPNTYYVDRAFLFNVGDRLVSSDLITTLRASLLEILDPLAGLIKTSEELHSSGILVRDYELVEGEDEWSFHLDVPNYRIGFTGSILDLTITDGETDLVFASQENVDPETLFGGRLTYPLLPGFAKIINARRSLAEDGITKLFILRIDRELSLTQDRLAAIVEVFNSTIKVIDFTINKSNSKVRCLNQSGLCRDLTRFSYHTFEAQIPQPQEMTSLEVDSSLSNVSLSVALENPTSFLKDLEKLRITFFNGFEAQAPSFVDFLINDSHTFSCDLENSKILDGYTEGFYDSENRTTGQILGFDIDLDGYFSSSQESLEKIVVTFQGEPKYLIGDLLVGSNESLENTNLKITLNQETRFISPETFNRNRKNLYKVSFTNSLLQIELNGKMVFQDSLALQNPNLDFFAVGKTFGDRFTAYFYAPQVQRYFTSSPSKLVLTGRFLEIEGELLNL